MSKIQLRDPPDPIIKSDQEQFDVVMSGYIPPEPYFSETYVNNRSVITRDDTNGYFYRHRYGI